MKKILTVAIALPLAVLSQNFREKALEPFNKIQASGVAKIYYTSSDTSRLKMVGSTRDMDNTETRVEKGTLYIITRGKYDDPISIFVSNNSLNDVTCSGANTFKTVNKIKADSISFSVSGTANLNVQLESKKVNLVQSGAGEVTMSGNTEGMKAEVSGASMLRSYDLVCRNASISVAGASHAKVYVTDRIVANASGASSIKIKGDAREVIAEATTASSISKIVDGKSGDNKGDSTTFRWKGKRIIIIGEDKEEHNVRITHDVDFDHWAGFSIGVNGLLTPDASFTMDKRYRYLDLNYSRCINFQLNFFQHNFHIYKDYVNLVTGFGIEWRRYMLEHKTTLNPDSSFTWGAIDSTNNFRYDKNLFKSTMLQVPLLLDFNTSSKPDKSFHISVGVIGQFMVNSKTKQKLNKDGYEYTKIDRDSYNMAPLCLKAHASVGYSKFTVFGEYNITGLFTASAGPQVYPFVAGVRLVAF
jgi:hypothetical protein